MKCKYRQLKNLNISGFLWDKLFVFSIQSLSCLYSQLNHWQDEREFSNCFGLPFISVNKINTFQSFNNKMSSSAP